MPPLLKPQAIKKDFRKALDDTGLVVPMATTNLFGDPVFKDGAFTANNPKVRAYAIQKTMNAIDLGVNLAPKSMSSGAGAKAPKRIRPRTPLKPSSATAKR